MTAINQDIGVAKPFIQGDTLTLDVPVTEPDQTAPIPEDAQIPVDLSGAAIRWETTRMIGGVPVIVAPPLVAKSVGAGIEILAAEVGEDFPNKFRLTIDSADSEDLAGTYHHEAEATFVTGVRSTVLTGRWVIQRAGIKPAA